MTGWLAGRIGRKQLLMASIAGFTLASALCGMSNSLAEIVGFRLLQGLFGAALIPLSQAVLLDVWPRAQHSQAMAIWAMGAILGPILGPALGGWLTDNLDWRWVFYINLPVGLLAFTGVVMFISGRREDHPRPFDFFGFGTLAVFIASFQLMLDRGPSQDWFSSREIWTEAVVALIAFWLFIVHSMTAKNPFFDRGTRPGPALFYWPRVSWTKRLRAARDAVPDGLDEPRLIVENGRRATHWPHRRAGAARSRSAAGEGEDFRGEGADRADHGRAADGTMTIDDCEDASEALSPVFDVEDPSRRPTGSKFPRRASTGRWCASRIFVARSATRRGSKWRSPVDGRKRFRGVIEAVPRRRALARAIALCPPTTRREDDDRRRCRRRHGARRGSC